MFVQDDWRFRPNLTISTGVRWETQTNISDHHDFAPRIAVAWAPGAKKGQASKTVIRTGGGMFYDRVNENTTLQTLRFNGISQLNYQLTATNFPLTFYPNVPPALPLAAPGLLRPRVCPRKFERLADGSIQYGPRLRPDPVRHPASWLCRRQRPVALWNYGFSIRDHEFRCSLQHHNWRSIQRRRHL